MIQRVILIILLGTCTLNSFSQSRKNKKRTDVLFTINNKPVRSDEFVYLYNKNHQSKPDEFTKDDILEYLNLFINFKLKVEEARQRGMDTTSAFKSEYNSYRNELIKPHLPESKIIDSLTALTYDRLKEEVRASHILISVKPDASPADTLAAYNKITDLRKRILTGEDFESLALNYSEDPSVRTNKGDLGYFTALQMVYPFESAAYETLVGEVSDPIRTNYGYHLIQVIDKKPSRGEVEVAHIMIRANNRDGSVDARNLIFNIYDQLMAGASWDELCHQYSEDQSSKENGGKLRAFGVRAMAPVPEFERMAFSLQKPGDISDPFQTAYGWHIVRLERKIPLPSFDQVKQQLRGRVARDERVQISRKAWHDKLKREFGFKENGKAKSYIFEMADSLLANNNSTNSPLAGDTQVLFTTNNQRFATAVFLDFVVKNQRLINENGSVKLEELYDQYVGEELKKLLEDKIADENPEFKMLSTEYYEGIMLFEIMEDEVWNKAADDSIGQLDYFNRHRSNYQAGERVEATLYSFADAILRNSMAKLLAGSDSVALEKFISKNGIKKEEGIFQKGDNSILNRIAWHPGIYPTEYNGMYYLAQIRNILPPGEMTFDEARASVVADYQQELENTWIGQLKKKYPVKVNEKARQYVLDKLQK